MRVCPYSLIERLRNISSYISVYSTLYMRFPFGLHFAIIYVYIIAYVRVCYRDISGLLIETYRIYNDAYIETYRFFISRHIVLLTRFARLSFA